MKVVSQIIIMLQMILWVSCKGPSIRPQINADLNFTLNRCRVRCYDIQSTKSVPSEKCNRYYRRGKYPKNIPDYYLLVHSPKTDDLLFVSGDHPVETCNKLTGVFLEPFAREIKPWATKIREYFEDQTN
jgi:hypothetical protein